MMKEITEASFNDDIYYLVAHVQTHTHAHKQTHTQTHTRTHLSFVFMSHTEIGLCVWVYVCLYVCT